MTVLRSGAVPSISVGHEEDGLPAPDLIEASARAQEDATLYEAWLNAGKTREQLNAERREQASEHHEQPPKLSRFL